MRVNPININNTKSITPKQNVSFGKFADERAKQIASTKLNEIDFSALERVEGFIIYSDKESLRFVKDDKYISTRPKGYMYTAMLEPAELVEKRTDLLQGNMLKRLASISCGFLARENGWQTTRLKEDPYRLTQSEKEEIVRQQRIDNLAK